MTAELLNNINELLSDSNLGETFVEKVLKRLESFQYNLDNLNDNDKFLIVFAVQKVSAHVRTVTHNNIINEKLFPIIVERVCGEFLNSKAKSGQLTETMIDVEAAVESIKIGDTNITYAVGAETTFEQRVQALITYLTECGEGDILCFRQISW